MHNMEVIVYYQEVYKGQKKMMHISPSLQSLYDEYKNIHLLMFSHFNYCQHTEKMLPPLILRAFYMKQINDHYNALIQIQILKCQNCDRSHKTHTWNISCLCVGPTWWTNIRNTFNFCKFSFLSKVHLILFNSSCIPEAHTLLSIYTWLN